MDYYQQDRSRLNGQPKRTIGDYVESQGILVPRRFDTLEQARASGLPIIARSEHAQDYDGSSGLMASPRISFSPMDSITRTIFQSPHSFADIKQFTLDTCDGALMRNIRMHCAILEIAEQKFIDNYSFSLWEHLGGINRKVVADSAIVGKYHVLSNVEAHTQRVRNYSIVHPDGSIEVLFDEFSKPYVQGMREAVDAYKSIQVLPRFDHDHCPIMEFQTVDNRVYFLQYHIGTDAKIADFELDGPPDEKYIRCDFVRGATSKNGLHLNANYRYAWTITFETPKISTEDIACIGETCNHPFAEIMARQRLLVAMDKPDVKTLYFGAVTGHGSISQMFKPAISLAVDADVFIQKKERDAYRMSVFKDGLRKNLSIPIHVISDGKNAYIKKVD